MALENLVAELEREGESKIAAQLEAARSEAARLEAEARSRRTEHRAQVLRERQLELQHETKQMVAIREREARKELLLARHRLLDRILQRMLELMPEVVQSEPYLASLPGELTSALSYLGPTGGLLRCSHRLSDALQTLVAAERHLKLTEDPALAPGFQVTSDDGTVLVDRTLPRRLDLEQARMRLEILQELHRP